MSKAESIRNHVFEWIKAKNILLDNETVDFEFMNSTLHISQIIENLIMSNSWAFADFLDVFQKYKSKIAQMHHGALPIAYYYERFLKYGDSKEFLG